MDIEEKFNLITRNLDEIRGADELKALLQERDPIIYWGTAPTGRIHIGYYVPLLKIADYLQAGCKVKVLIADIHAFLDNIKSNLTQVKFRTQYYKYVIVEMLNYLGVSVDKLTFIEGTSFQLTPEYMMDVYKLNSLVGVSNAKHAGAEVVKQSNNPSMTSLLYPTLQALDEEYLKVDIQHGGIDQRKIFMFAREYLPKIGYKKRIHLMNGMVPGLRFKQKETVSDDIAEKMSASDVDSKIDVLDTKNNIRKKINRSYCLEGDIYDNTVLTVLEKIIFPVLKCRKEDFIINRKEQFGGPLVYTDFDKLKEQFAKKMLHPQDMKIGVSDSLINFTENIRNLFSSSKEMQQLLKNAY